MIGLHETIDFLLDDLYCETLCKEIVLTCFFVHILWQTYCVYCKNYLFFKWYWQRFLVVVCINDVSGHKKFNPSYIFNGSRKYLSLEDFMFWWKNFTGWDSWVILGIFCWSSQRNIVFWIRKMVAIAINVSFISGISPRDIMYTNFYF